MIENAEELAEAIKLRPTHIAICLQRIARFNGQHALSNVLVHSLDVAMRLERQGHPVAVVTWGLLHDAHELLTGDVARHYKLKALTHMQHAIDEIVMRELSLAISFEEMQLVNAADNESGNDEHHYGDDVKYYQVEDEPIQQFVDLVHRWLDHVSQ